MLKPAFIDISHWQTIPESLVEARGSGLLGCIHKATEGLFSVDEKLKGRAHLAKEAGLLFGTYHFIRPGEIREQAAFYVNTVLDAQPALGDAKQWLWALDYEDPDVSLDDCFAFMKEVEEITGHVPVLYSGHVLKEKMATAKKHDLCFFPLWLAQYGPEPELPIGWYSWWGWQYTEDGVVPGIEPPTDLNAYDGTAEELAASWSGHLQIKIEPAPPEGITIAINVPEGTPVTVTINGARVG